MSALLHFVMSIDTMLKLAGSLIIATSLPFSDKEKMGALPLFFVGAKGGKTTSSG
jgi:hypothetical protein